MLKFTAEHEWLELDGDVATVGITTYAVEQLGDLVFVELPEVGKSFAKNDDAATVESVKAAFRSLLSARRRDHRCQRGDRRRSLVINSDPQGASWLFKLKLKNRADADGLLDEAAYKELIA